MTHWVKRITLSFRNLLPLAYLWWYMARAGKTMLIERKKIEAPAVEEQEPLQKWTLFDSNVTDEVLKLGLAFTTELIILRQMWERELPALATAFNIELEELEAFFDESAGLQAPAALYYSALRLTPADEEDVNIVARSVALRYNAAMGAGMSFQQYTMLQGNALSLAEDNEPEDEEEADMLYRALQIWSHVTRAHAQWLARAELGEDFEEDPLVH